jgi:hypothetical protein
MQRVLACVVRYAWRCFEVAALSVVRASQVRDDGEGVMAVKPGVLIGGPLCGSMTAPAARLDFVWCQASATRNGEPRARVFAGPGPSRSLYRSLGQESGHELFVFAGHTHAYCRCGGYTLVAWGEEHPRCRGCGLELRRHVPK